MFQQLCASVLLLALGASVAAVEQSKLLHNAAVKGLFIPTVGIGTGGYGSASGAGGEHWDDSVAFKAVSEWLKAGGRRIDTADDYGTQIGVGKAILESGIPRSEIFITSKVGPVLPLGFNSTLQQVDSILQQLQTPYVDLLLIHWPGPREGIPTWPCYIHEPPSFRTCRQESWRALEQVFNQGRAKAIGVSNFEKLHLEDILQLKSLKPSVNQFEFHPYWHEDDLVAYCESLNITVNGYSPLGAPDHTSSIHQWTEQPLAQAAIARIAHAHQKSPAQVIIRWELQAGLVVNPRTEDPSHMAENLDVFDFTLTESEANTIAAIQCPSPCPFPKVTPDPRQIP